MVEKEPTSTTMIALISWLPTVGVGLTKDQCEAGEQPVMSKFKVCLRHAACSFIPTSRLGSNLDFDLTLGTLYGLFYIYHPFQRFATNVSLTIHLKR